MALWTNMRKHPKTGVYRFRKGVPPELRPFLPAPHTGKSELIKSYGTKDSREAARIHIEVSREMERVLDQARAAYAASLDQAGVDASAMARHPQTAYERALAEMRDEPNFFISRDSSTLPPGLRQLVPMATPNTVVESPPPHSPSPAGDSISTVFAEYQREVRLSADITNDFRRSWQLFCEIVGLTMDSPITQPTKAHVRTFKQAMRDFPVGATKKEFRGKTALEMVAMARADEAMPRIADGTLNKHISALSAVMKFAVANDYRTDDPTKGLNIKAPKKKARQPYNAADLKGIFGSVLFKAEEWNERQWLPILALYTGCRLEELGQLLVSDVRAEDGAWFFAIQEVDDEGNEVKSVKTDSSVRNVPVHPKLVELGFFDYLDGIKAEGHKQVFPNLREWKGMRTVYFSKWYGRQRKRFGIADTRKVFHSFRHSFKDACRRASIPEDVHDALTGHSNGSVGRTYGLGHAISVLAQWLEKVSYDVEIPRAPAKLREAIPLGDKRRLAGTDLSP